MTLEVTLLKLRPDGNGYDVVKKRKITTPGYMKNIKVGEFKPYIWLQSELMTGVVSRRGLDAQVRHGKTVEKTDAFTVTTKDGRIIELTPPNKISPLLVIEQKP